MLIKNLTTSPHLVPVVKDGKIVENLMFMPGVNEVDPDFWADLIDKDIVFAGYLADGEFEEVEAEGPANLREAPAIKLVKDTVVDALLAAWEVGEKRPKVKSALKAQRAKLVLKAPEKKAAEPEKAEDEKTQAQKDAERAEVK